jgi:hypothetical protein
LSQNKTKQKNSTLCILGTRKTKLKSSRGSIIVKIIAEENAIETKITI